MFKSEVYSEIIRNLEKEIKSGNKSAVKAFWDKIEIVGTPIIESIQGDESNVLMTYIYRGYENIKNVVVMHPTNWKDYNENMLINIPDTDIWYKSYVMINDVRGRYDFSVNDALDDDWEKRSNNIKHDIYNKNRIIFKGDEGEEDSIVSYFEMPKAEEYIWTIERNDINKGTIETHDIYFKGLDDKRKIYVYKPYNYSKNTTYKLLVLTDGDAYLNILSANTVIDNLIADGIIDPIIVVLIDEGNKRNEELMCNEDFASRLALEIMPWIKINFPVSMKGEDVTIGGFSLGGLFAAYMGLHHPKVFGNVISQSGSFYCSPDSPEEVNWIIKKYEEAEKLPNKFFINVGVLECMEFPPYSSMIDVSRKMRDVLTSKKSCVVRYEEFKSGHDYLCWGETLSNGVRFIFGK